MDKQSRVSRLKIKNTNIKMDYWNFKDGHLSALIDQSTDHIQSISLVNNGLQLPGIRLFCQGLWTSLQSLDLTGNSIGNYGCKLLSTINFEALSSITLDDNQIGTEGMMHFCKCQIPTMMAFSIDKNYLTDNSSRWTVRIHSPFFSVYQPTNNPDLSYSQLKHLLLSYQKFPHIFVYGCGLSESESNNFCALSAHMTHASSESHSSGSDSD